MSESRDIRYTISASQPSWPPRPEARNAPDVIVVLCDDMGFSDLACFGSEISTPELDALASRRRKTPELPCDSHLLTVQGFASNGDESPSSRLWSRGQLRSGVLRLFDGVP